jgi:hypothetical protein
MLVTRTREGGALSEKKMKKKRKKTLQFSREKNKKKNE